VHEDTVIVVAGGGPPDPRVLAALPDGARVVAADQGLEHALALGLLVDVAVGDFDSALPAAVEAAEAAGVRIERHPPEKDATDLELALDAAAALGAARIVVLGTDGGRLDHLVAGLLGACAERYAAIEIDALLGPATVHVVRGARRLPGEPGELVSLLAVNGPAEGVATAGLTYPLRGETLAPGSSRGVSNVFSGREAIVTVEHGVLLAIRPAPESEKAL
jgi:thiamine pyrophosphokinase